MNNTLTLGEAKINWLQGGVFELDGGNMFGVVPKVLWEKKYPCGENGYILLANNAILVRTGGQNIIIDTGLGNKLTAKQRRIFRVTAEWDLPAQLQKLGLAREDIGHVIVTHCDFDHAGGIVMQTELGTQELTFPRALHHIQQSEWEDVLQPNVRSIHSYWQENVSLLHANSLLHLVDGEEEIVPGVKVERSGGHTRGHQIVWIDSTEGRAVHLGDLLPNHAHLNPLWVTPFDNFPLDSVYEKTEKLRRAEQEERWLLFYHDPYMNACRHQDEDTIIATI